MTDPVQEPATQILRIKEVEKRVGFKRCYIYRLIRNGLFPDRVRIGVQAVGWDSRLIDKWVADRLSQKN
ncbi:MAG: helix-turn-helix transcriptional regulator [Saezia sp.]